VFPLFVATLASAGVALYSWRRRSAPGAASFTLLMLAVAEWSLTYALRLGSADLLAKLFWAKIRYLGIITVPTAWLIFVLQYTDREKWLTPRNVAMLAIEPFITLTLAWTNESHHLMWSDIGLKTSGSLLVWDATYGAWHKIHSVYTYALLLFSMLLLARSFARSPRLRRGQIGALLASALTPLMTQLLFDCNLISSPLDLAPFAFTIAGLMVAWGAYRFRLFDIVPIARNAVVDSMSGGVLVLDGQNYVLDINLAAQRIIGQASSEIVGMPIAQVLADVPDLIEHCQGETEMRTEITWGEGKSPRIYDVRISPIYSGRKRFIGRLVVLHDITERKRAEASLVDQKQLFENLVAMARATVKPLSLEATLESTLNMAAALTGAEQGSMFLLDGTGVVTHSVLAREETTQEQQQELVRRVMEKGLAGWVVRHRRPALVHDTSHDDRWLKLPEVPYTTRSALAIPIVSGSAVLGVLTLMHPAPNHFHTKHAYLIQSAASQIMLAVRNAQMYEGQRRLATRQTTLYETLRAVGGHLDPEAIAHTAVETVARLTGWPAVAILLPDKTYEAKTTHLVVHAVAGALSIAEGQHLSVDRGVTGRAFRTVEAQHVPDVSSDPDYVDAHPAHRSELAIPLRRGERVLGVLDVAGDRPAAFGDDDIMLAKSLAEAIALTLDNARLYAEIRQYAADLGALYTVARAISRSWVLEDVLSEALRSALTSLGFEVGLIGLVDPIDKHLYLAREQGLPPVASNRLRQSLEGTLCTYVHDQGEAVTLTDIEEETPALSKLKRDMPQAVDEMRSLGMRSYFGIPLLHQERPLGTLSLFARQPRDLSVENQALLRAIGQQIATAVSNVRLFHAIADERSRLRALIESSRDGVVLVGMDQRILVVNAPALDLLRLTGHPKDWVNKPVQDALTLMKRYASDVAQTIYDEMNRVQKGDESSGEGEFEVPPCTIHWLNLPVTTDETPLGRLLVLHDVTDERLLERMRDDLVHTMVHDLRNPLTAIYGALALLDKRIADTLSPGQLQLWDITQSNTDRMLRLVNAILDISRLESQQMPIEHTLISLNDLVTDVLNTQLALAADKGLYVESDVPSTLPPVWADARLIERVLHNLVGNAIKFTPNGGEVRLFARWSSRRTANASGWKAPPRKVRRSPSRYRCPRNWSLDERATYPKTAMGVASCGNPYSALSASSPNCILHRPSRPNAAEARAKWAITIPPSMGASRTSVSATSSGLMMKRHGWRLLAEGARRACSNVVTSTGSAPSGDQSFPQRSEKTTSDSGLRR